MKGKDVLENAEKRAAELLKGRAADLEKRSAEIERNKEIIAKAKATMTAAIAAENAAEFTRAKHEADEASVELEYNEKVAETISAKVIADKAEVNATVEDLKQYITDKDTAYFDKILEHANAIRKLAVEFIDIKNRARKAISTWNCDIGKQASGVYNPATRTETLADEMLNNPKYKGAVGIDPFANIFQG